MNQWILNKRYQLQKRLSKKGARHTFIAKDLQTNQPVVVKVLLFGPDFQWQDHKLFERGAAELNYLRQSRRLILLSVSPSKGQVHEPPKGDNPL